MKEHYYKLLLMSKEDEWKAVEKVLLEKIENNEIRNEGALSRQFHDLKYLNINKIVRFDIIYRQISALIARHSKDCEDKDRIAEALIIFARDKDIFDYRLFEDYFATLIDDQSFR